METYYIGLYSDSMKEGEYTAFIVKNRDNIPQSAKGVRAIPGENKEDAFLKYIAISQTNNWDMLKALQTILQQIENSAQR